MKKITIIVVAVFLAAGGMLINLSENNLQARGGYHNGNKDGYYHDNKNDGYHNNKNGGYYHG